MSPSPTQPRINLLTILCPVDFSAATAGLVSYAATLAASMGAELRLLHVLEPQLALHPTASEPATSQLARYQIAAEAAGARTSTAVQPGDAAPEIIAEARRLHAELIVIGTHGHTGLARFLMGHTAEAVVRAAPCATLLVKPPPAATEYRRSA